MPRIETRAVRGMDLRARRRVARGLPPDLRPREDQLAELQQRLQVDCDHNNFTYEGGKTPENPGYCEICEYDGWIYIFRCNDCGFTACRNCHNFLTTKRGENLRMDFINTRRHYDDETDDESDESVSEAESIQNQDTPREESNSNLEPTDGMPKSSPALNYFLQRNSSTDS